MNIKALMLLGLLCLAEKLPAQFQATLKTLPEALDQLKVPGDFIQLRIDPENRLSTTPDFSRDSLVSRSFDAAIAAFLSEQTDKKLQLFYYSDSSHIRNDHRIRSTEKAAAYLKERIVDFAAAKNNLEIMERVVSGNYRGSSDLLGRPANWAEKEDYLFVRLLRMNYIVTDELTGEKSVIDLLSKDSKNSWVSDYVLVDLAMDSSRNHGIEIYRAENNGSGNNVFLIEVYKGTEDHQIVSLVCDFPLGLEIVTQSKMVRETLLQMKADSLEYSSYSALLNYPPEDIEEMVIVHYSAWCMETGAVFIRRKKRE
ncbi:MAG: hypothetical protein ACI81P_001453 [Neolewinella sp.]|jgi:hypothetical protein